MTTPLREPPGTSEGGQFARGYGHCAVAHAPPDLTDSDCLAPSEPVLSDDDVVWASDLQQTVDDLMRGRQDIEHYREGLDHLHDPYYWADDDGSMPAVNPEELQAGYEEAVTRCVALMYPDASRRGREGGIGSLSVEDMERIVMDDDLPWPHPHDYPDDPAEPWEALKRAQIDAAASLESAEVQSLETADEARSLLAASTAILAYGDGVDSDACDEAQCETVYCKADAVAGSVFCGSCLDRHEAAVEAGVGLVDL